MAPIYRATRTTCALLMLLCLPVLVPAIQAAELPEREAVQEQLDGLADRNMPAARQRLIRQDLEQTLAHLDEYERNRQRLRQLRERVEEVPVKTLQAEQSLENFAPEDTSALRERLAAVDIRTLVETLFERLGTLQQQQEQQSRVSAELASAQLLPERTQAAIATTLSQMERARAELIRFNVNDDAPEQLAAIDRLRSEIAALESRLTWHRAELQSTSSLQTLANRQHTLLQRQISDTEAQLDVIQALLDEKRSERTRALIDAARAPMADLPDSALLSAELQRNTRIAERIMVVTDQVGVLLRQNLALNSQLERVHQLERSLVEQVAALQGSLLLSRMLYQQQQMLPRLAPGSSLQIDIADLRLEQFQLTEQRNQLTSLSAAARQLLQDSSDADDPAVLEALTQILRSRRELLEQLDPEMSRLLNLAINNQATRQQLQSANRIARATISEQLFWMPSTRPLNLDTLRVLPRELVSQFSRMGSLTPWQQAGERLMARWPIPAAALLLSVVLLLRRPAMSRRLAEINDQVGYLRHDTQEHTPKALLLELLRVGPVPLLLATLGLVLRTGDTLGATLIGAVLIKVAMIWLVFGLLYRMLGKQGIAVKHFRWPEENVQRLRRSLMVIALVFVPMAMVIAIGEQAPELLANDRLGLLVMLFTGPMLGVLMWRATQHYPYSRDQVKLVRGTTALTVAAIPLVLSVLSVLGYHYTAIRLGGRLVDTFYILLLWVLVAATARRGLAVAARRLAYRRAVAKREEEQKHQEPRSDAEAGEAVEEPPLDLDRVSHQSLRLTNLFLLISFTVVIYLIWSDLLGAMAYLENVVLWQQVIGEGEQATFVSTSLRDMIFAFATILISLMMARNLPGLLEVLVLSRLSLRPGSAYAITSLLAYIITAIGLVVALGAMGVSWSKLQWLVAALGVGLGFGLQEIFANFVSGLIILFERPIRIGDVITIGDLSGTVTRIRIRATTIRDFDRKEIIIPNKAFVTDRLINWSLSDNVTRLVLKVGFAYGSDLARAKDVLLQAAAENPRVLADPVPTAFFLGFGASTLDHELRVHVGELADRLPVQDELNRHIDRLCKENGLEIAFSQLDVHIKSGEGKELYIKDARAGKDENGDENASDDPPPGTDR
ncbi:mechanosensitive channel MscK [Alcanivorax sp. JB21]|uniref:mechanosensitive channel MscK n=1 Tax=Alcanivorax limicola TaxID=2874102 RepID=UPI001CBEE9AA|nr:mechanosensitive channel MscK [Alcanivorax limicola]MBZ2189593.1 mechanosensitive channel MscK [Alcanivorax limicola]